MDKIEMYLSEAKKSYQNMHIPEELYSRTSQSLALRKQTVRRRYVQWKKGLVGAAVVTLFLGGMYTGISLYQQNEENRKWMAMDWENIGADISEAVGDAAMGREIRVEISWKESE